MSESFRIEGKGRELVLPRDRYRFVPPGILAYEETYAPVVELAVRNGGVRFSTPDLNGHWRSAAMLRVAAPWLVFERYGVREGVAARLVEAHGCPLLAVVPDYDLVDVRDWDMAPELALGKLTPAERPGEFRGEGWTLSAHPLARTDRRDWAWAWGGGSYGPVLLSVSLGRSAIEIETWLLSQAPLPYRREGGAEYHSMAEVYGEGRLYVADGSLTFMRSYRDVSDAVLAVDAGLSDALAKGALGPITWDVREDDYGSYLATGESGESLAEYLEPAADESALRERWSRIFAEHAVDAHGCQTPDEAARVLGRALGLHEVHSASELEPSLKAADFGSLPRCLTLELDFDFDKAHGAEWLFQAVGRAHPRLSWSVRYSQQE